ncbi:unnamed protein product [Owenia fusiformis]|uniref:Tubulin polyglutamylase complex subunit 1-like C-terminal domain-containing protein n=1 Tax=Owenia fusiformis TaxID=6347 RepID=A0A8J1Y4V0_OWEFU|nr:unnamed protein product [Owenia fusiformis]
MGDKKKVSDDKPQSETERQFLERTQVSSQIKDVLTKVIENRPLDPIAFIADYFESVGDKSNRLSKSHQQLLLTHHSRPAFEANVRIAYDILSLSKAKPHSKIKAGMKKPTLHKTIRGINGSVFMDLLNLLTEGMVPGVKEKLYKKLQCKSHEVIRYDIFRSGIFACFVLQDFLKEAEGLYCTLDLGKTGKADKALCDTALHQLLLSVSTANNTGELSALEAGYNLGPDKLYTALNQALSVTTEKGTISCDDFLIAAADAFLLKVNNVN